VKGTEKGMDTDTDKIAVVGIIITITTQSLNLDKAMSRLSLLMSEETRLRRLEPRLHNMLKW